MLQIKHFYVIIFLLMLLVSSCAEKVPPPKPYGVVPSERQLEWQDMETYAFLHFTVNTFTAKQWGYGDEKPEIFNPSDFSADQIIGTLAKAGFKGAIITAKHHDGFCLWPSKYTEHSVKNSPWKNGKGDVVREMSDACKKYGIKFGIYLSPWDRNHPDYGNEKYIEYYRNQLRELLTNYGDVFEVWFDGANGGDGFYGGANEKRLIDRTTYYGWEKNFSIVREFQPLACIFSDIGPDIRWVGNEHGHANDSCWATYTPLPKKGYKKASIGTTKYWLGETGTMNGKYWIPAETDVSIRPGWFYDPKQNDKVKTLDQLLDIYFHSVGNGTSLNLNVPPDRKGRIYPVDSIRLMEFKDYLDKAFDDNLLEGSKVKKIMLTEGDARGKGYGPEKMIDGKKETYWALKDGVKSGTVEIALKKPVTFNCMVLQEYTPLGQRVKGFDIKIFKDGKWQKVAKGSTIGYKKIIRFDDCTADRISLSFDALACPVLSNLELYKID